MALAHHGGELLREEKESQATLRNLQLDRWCSTALTLWRRTMQVVYDGRTAEVPCKPGAEGLDDFKRQVRHITRAVAVHSQP